jgi:gliding motility-associated-like protein
MNKTLSILFIIGIGFIVASLNDPIIQNDFDKDPDNCLDDLKIPKRFTPDGDTLDDFFIVDFPCRPESFEFQIWDMAGKQVYVVKSSEVQWNGDDAEGKPCDSGIYNWKIKYMYHMNYVERKGQTLLLR